MTKEELLSKLSDIEWDDFEVKASTDDLSKSVRDTVSAFCNTGGGWIILGVGQNKNGFFIKGLTNPEKIEQDFISQLSGLNLYSSLIVPKVEKYNFYSKIVLGFYIPSSPFKPVYYGGNNNNTFIRTGSGDRRASKEEINALLRDQSFGTLSSKPTEYSDLELLHQPSINRFRDYMARFNPNHKYNALSTYELFIKTGIIVNDKITYAGFLMFGKEETITPLFPDFRIDLLEIPGTSYSNSIRRYDFRLEEQENLWEYYFALFYRLRQRVDNLFTGINQEGIGIEDAPQIEAIREALVNLIIHADYFSTMKPRIRLFDDKIEFQNPGSLPKPIEILINEDISMPRNPVLAKLFRAVKLAENAGFGIDKMRDGWNGFAKSYPIFNSDVLMTSVSFVNLEYYDTYISPKQNPSEYPSEYLSETTNHPSEYPSESRKHPSEYPSESTNTPPNPNELNDLLQLLPTKQAAIIELIFHNNLLGRKELADLLKISETTIKDHLEALTKKGYLIREGTKGGRWIVQLKKNKA
jgi:ATP-dependent DNA helicase RecG